MFARFDENPAMTLQDIKKKKTLRTDARTDAHTDAHTHRRENSIPTTNKVCGGYKHARTHTGMHTRTHTHRQRENSIPTTNKVCRGGGGGYKYPACRVKEKIYEPNHLISKSYPAEQYYRARSSVASFRELWNSL